MDATSSLKSALDANMDLAHRNNDLELESEVAKGEAAEIRKIIESLRVENGFLQERYSVVEEKENTTAHRIYVLSDDVVDLRQKVTKLTLDLEEERSLRVRAKKDLDEL